MAIYRVKQTSNLKTGDGLHGADISGAQIGIGTIVVIGEIGEHGWGKIIGPKQPEAGWLVKLDGTYLNYGQVAWIEMAHLATINDAQHKYIIITDATTGNIISTTMEY